MSMMQMLLATYGGGGLSIDDVYSSTVYTGNESTNTINNGLDLSGEGGLVILKKLLGASNFFVYDTERGTNDALRTNVNNAETTFSNSLTSFNSNGFTLGSSNITNDSVTPDYISFAFRKTEEFFDVVSYTGNGATSRNLSHSLGTLPGMMWIKKVSNAEDWIVYHRDNGANNFLKLNDNSGSTTAGSDIFAITHPTSSVFTVGNNTKVNANGDEYIAYLFADDTDSMIKCGTYNGNGGTQTINCGFQPQWVTIKSTSSVNADWVVFSSTRGTKYLSWDSINNEQPHAGFAFASNGFTLSNSVGTTNSSGKAYVYMAIAS
jgi:hypothetical protein|tara:strand:- start:269 stop:1228 length:960 start_codon:yes stop_codon:yes gene_type:complete